MAMMNFLKNFACCSGEERPQRTLSREGLSFRSKPRTWNVSTHLSADEDVVDQDVAAVLEATRALLPNQHMSAWQRDWCTPETVRIYLRGRDGNVAKAAEILAQALKWREENKEILSGARVPEWQSDFRVLTRGTDGIPLIYMCYQHQVTPNVKKICEHGAVVLEAAVRSLPKGVEQFDVFIDIFGFSARHLDARALFGLMKMIQQPYRDRLRTGYLIDAPRAFSSVYALGSKLVNEKTRKKGVFVTPEEAVAHVLATGGAVASEKLQEAIQWNRKNVGCNPGAVFGRRLPSELPDTPALSTPFHAKAQKDVVAKADAKGASDAVVVATEGKVKATRTGLCCRRRGKQGTVESLGAVAMKWARQIYFFMG